MTALWSQELNEYIYNNCIELPNGDTVTPKDAVAWLKQNKRGGMNVVCASGSIMGNSHTPSAMSI